MANDNPYASYGGSLANADSSDPYKGYGGKTTPTPTGPTPEKPGFFTRLGQSLGLPTSEAEAQANAPQTVSDALKQGLAASTGFLPSVLNYGKQAIKGTLEGKQDVDEAVQNITQGGPVGANIGKAASGVLHAALSQTPVVGPTIDTAGQDVSQGNYSGAAGGITGAVAQIEAPNLLHGAGELVGKTADTVKRNFSEPPKPTLQPETPAPVSSPTQIDVPFDDATIRKTSGKDLNPGAREALRNAAGPVIEAGSSPELHLLKAVPEINSAITTDGNALAKLLKDNGPISESPKANVTEAIENLREALPGGTEESFGKAIDKELTKAKDVLDSTDPIAINDYIRTLDKSISSYTAPEDGIDTASNAADAARVTIRRALRDTINEEIPGTKPINTSLSNNIEARSVLRKRLGAVADDSSAATQQYQSELAKGKAQLQREDFNQGIRDQYEQQLQRIRRNKSIAKTVGLAAGGAGLAEVGKSAIKQLVP